MAEFTARQGRSPFDPSQLSDCQRLRPDLIDAHCDGALSDRHRNKLGSMSGMSEATVGNAVEARSQREARGRLTPAAKTTLSKSVDMLAGRPFVRRHSSKSTCEPH